MTSLAGAAVFAVALVSLTACGGDDSANGGRSTTTVTATAEAPRSPSIPAPVPADRPGDADPTSDAAAAATVPTSPARGTVDPKTFASYEQGGAAYYFYSPSLNVGCGIYVDGYAPDGVGCQAVTSVPTAQGLVCKNGGASVYGISIAKGRASAACFNQGIYFGADKTKVLPYGQSIVVGTRSCTSTTIGMTCYDGAAGFTLARDRNETY
ncbi:hypothetical protein [Williamsia sp. CHRR-6]|uniref:hypothetical protein n=1 Tax=Williamsia sp. CHRR-6 TaxID=2835871 RepID=UPI001BDAED0B|nr:hypothetical protein [Williamsia sp. CHRR-6]MBT0567216.1 hypothetical protein [Williamsia sp. CHRR-6]